MIPNLVIKGPELWGGIECTVNRVGLKTYDQVARSGFDARPSDLDMFASLGIRKMRYPILWERIAPNGLNEADWSRPDQQLAKLQQLGIVPIAGLLHHGSGPQYTSLIDPEFPWQFAAYASAVARRYPWITHFAPLNEPLTTARFSGLYGHWHPHGTDDETFARVLLNQCKAIVLATRAIRSIIPDAKFVVTEDVAPVFSTAAMRYQAEFENERRWSSLDILCGTLIRNTHMRDHFSWLGIGAEELDWFEDQASPPDLIGIDYYPTSERFLDENWDLYPISTRGGNGRHDYADVEAVRVREEGLAGQESIIRETWSRYKIPIALTECHIACNVHEQIEWLAECWSAAVNCCRQGIPATGVTLWSLLGAFEWNTLCTEELGYYEPGAFDISSGAPVSTALATAATAIADGSFRDGPAPGWWRRPDRLLYRSPSENSVVKAGELAQLV